MTDVDLLIRELHPARQDKWATGAYAGVLTRALDGQRITEPQVNALLTDTSGTLEAAIIRALAGAAGVTEDMTGWRLDTWAELREQHPVSRTRIPGPDFIISDSTDVPRMITEGKRDAWVNGRQGYCRSAGDDKTHYSNQILCYPHACWVEGPLADLVRQATFVWLSPARHHGPDGPWGRRAVNATDNRDYYGDAYDRQKAIASRWHPYTWEALSEAVEGASAGGRVLARVINSWIVA